MVVCGLGHSVAIIAILQSLQLAAGHGRLTFPSSRDQRTNCPEYISNAPANYDSMFVCRNIPPLDPLVTLKTGGTFEVQWDFTAKHTGDCFLYLSYDTFASPTEMKWFKIAQFAECKNVGGVRQRVTIPAYLPQCDHCVLRWEWYAIHQWPAVEFYSQCVDVVIAGSPTGILPSPMATVPANLPPSRTPDAYRNPFDSAAPFFFTGPLLATLSGGVNVASGVRAPTPPAVPTPAPAPAPAPTPSSDDNGLDCSELRDGVYCEQGNCCDSFTLCAAGQAYRDQAVPPGTVCSNGNFVAVNTGDCKSKVCNPFENPTQAPPMVPAPASTPTRSASATPRPISCPSSTQSVRCYPSNWRFYICDLGKPSSVFSTGSNGIVCYNGGRNSRMTIWTKETNDVRVQNL